MSDTFEMVKKRTAEAVAKNYRKDLVIGAKVRWIYMNDSLNLSGNPQNLLVEPYTEGSDIGTIVSGPFGTWDTNFDVSFAWKNTPVNLAWWSLRPVECKKSKVLCA